MARPPLADFAYEEFAQREIAHLEERRLARSRRASTPTCASAATPTLVAELERLVAEHPLRERLRGQLMVALYRSGRQADALERYAAGRRALRDELGVEPGPELRELQVPHPAPGPGPAPPPGACAAPLRASAAGSPCWAPAARCARRRGRGGAASLGGDRATYGSGIGANALVGIDSRSGALTAPVALGVAPAGAADGRRCGSPTHARGGAAGLARGADDRAVVQTSPSAAARTGVAAGSGAVWVANSPRRDGVAHRPAERRGGPDDRVGPNRAGVAAGAGGGLGRQPLGDRTVSRIDRGAARSRLDRR